MNDLHIFVRVFADLIIFIKCIFLINYGSACVVSDGKCASLENNFMAVFKPDSNKISCNKIKLYQ